MKHYILILLICFPLFVGAQEGVFFKHKENNPKIKAAWGPSMFFSYALKQDRFVKDNNGMSPQKDVILPEILVGGQLLTDGFSISFHYGFLQHTIMIGGGLVFPIKKKK